MQGKEKRWFLLYGVLIFCLSGCSFVKTERKSENEAEITLALQDGTEEQSEKQWDLSRGDLLTMFEAVSNEEIISFLYDDYNKDGIHEAFVLTKEDDYTIWYMSSEGCELVEEGIEQIDEAQTDLLSYRTKDYAIIQHVNRGIPVTFLYSVDNNNGVIEPDISGCGYLRQNEKNELEFRIFNDTQGKKYCTYYLYYLMDDGFREYGAIPISEEQFLEFAGAGELLDEVKAPYGDKLIETSFLYRSNHYININLTIFNEGQLDYRNMTVYYDNTHVEKRMDKPSHGKVEIAHMLEIATFPTAFKHPNPIGNEVTE